MVKVYVQGKKLFWFFIQREHRSRDRFRIHYSKWDGF